MHMADALLAPAAAAALYAMSGTTAGLAVRQVKQDDTAQKLPVMAVTSALVFAGQMVNYTIPGTGASGHLCGGMLLTALLGPHAGFLSMSVILAIQCLFFADGGLMALGANIWNMAFYGCFAGYYLIWRPVLKSRLFSGAGERAAMRAKVILASVLGCVLTLQMGAFSVVIETSLSGITELPFGAFAALMQPVHIVIGLIEGAITAAVLVFVYDSRPELILYADAGSEGKGRRSFKRTLVVLSVLAVIAGGALSQFASSNPDGLEWSVERLQGASEVAAEESGAADLAASVQEKTAFLPDYAFKGSDSPAGTSASGIVGAAIVAGAAVLICFIGGFFRRKRRYN